MFYRERIKNGWAFVYCDMAKNGVPNTYFRNSILFSVVIFLSVVINLILRYPFTPHQLGADTYMIYIYSNVLVTNGYCPWLLHVLSYIGLYPFSYPLSGPVMISSISMLSGLDIEIIIYIVSTIFGILSFFTSFFAAELIINDRRFSLLTAFLYSTSPLLIKFTHWSMSTRGPYLVYLPLIIWAMFSVKRLKENFGSVLRPLIILLLLNIYLIATHRIFSSLLILYACTLLVLLFEKVSKLIMVKPRTRQKIEYTCTFSLFPIIVLEIVLIYAFAAFALYNIETKTISWLSAYKGGIYPLLTIVILYSVFAKYVAKNDMQSKLSGCSIILTLIILFLIQFTPCAPWQTYWWLRTRFSTVHIPMIFENRYMSTLLFVLAARLGPSIAMSIFFIIFYFILSKSKNYAITALILPVAIILPFFHIAPYFYQIFAPVYFILAAALLYSMLKVSTRTRSKVVEYIIIFSIIFILVFCVVATGYTINHRIKAGGDRPLNYLGHEGYDMGVYIKNMKGNMSVGDACYLGRLTYLIKTSVDINESLIEVWPSKIPSALDIQGWYHYLRIPFETYAYAGQKPQSYYLILDAQQSINRKNSLIIVSNGDSCTNLIVE